MKRHWHSFIFTGLLATGVAAAQQPEFALLQAAPQTDTRAMAPQHNEGHSKKLEKRFAHITKRYKLTPDQQSQLRSILLKEQRDMQTVNSDAFMSRGNKRDELVDLHEASQQKFGSILNDQQRHTFAADEKRRAWMDGRLPNPNPGPALNGW